MRMSLGCDHSHSVVMLIFVPFDVEPIPIPNHHLISLIDVMVSVTIAVFPQIIAYLVVCEVLVARRDIMSRRPTLLDLVVFKYLVAKVTDPLVENMVRPKSPIRPLTWKVQKLCL